ncbi:cache domain-containing sensor histidine kinase [Paenibacillus hamazuiensis]|uniref:cache domain-containing sensor histidine kinase n=1 Tax=Paenibacillus hamazuiensis TaxID=2936508 RepID=UPI00200F33F1|nr:sensor histidine kinase [Paenibacillus hamazuiensis]
MGSFASFRRKIGSWRIKHKVFALISLIMAVCFSVTYFSLSYAYSTYDEQLYAKSSQVLNLSSSRIENELKKIEQLSFTVATDPRIQDNLSVVSGSASEYEKHIARADLVDKLIQYSGYEKYISSLQIIDLSDIDYWAGQTETVSYAKRNLIRGEASKIAGELQWIYPDREEPYLIAAREIRSYNGRIFDLRPIGTLVVRIKIDAIVDDVLDGTELGKGEIRIVADGGPVYPNGDKEAFFAAGIRENSRSGYRIEQMEGKTYFLTHFRSSGYGWVYYGLIPFEQIFNRVIMMKRVLLIGFSVSLVALLALSVQFAKGITRPIENLIGQMKQVQRGDFSLAETDPAGSGPLPMDEVGQLHRTFRMMVQEINELITENYAKQLVIKETEFKALQAQINPHFLYNTLESINWLAKINKQTQISQMVEALGHLLRSSISLKDTLITVGAEIDIVLNYIVIQKYRFEERLQFELDVDERFRTCQIPKLTLQPLVENAINHALERMIDPCRIRVSVVPSSERLVLCVEDNGPGMEEDVLEKVLRGELRTGGKGIGLGNIRERIRIAFGDAYGVRVESAPGKGTRVFVDLPLEARET